MENSSRIKKNHLYNCVALVFLVMNYCRLYSARNNVFENLCTLQNNLIFKNYNCFPNRRFREFQAEHFGLFCFPFQEQEEPHLQLEVFSPSLSFLARLSLTRNQKLLLLKTHSLHLCSFGTYCKKTTFSFLAEFILILPSEISIIITFTTLSKTDVERNS